MRERYVSSGSVDCLPRPLSKWENKDNYGGPEGRPHGGPEGRLSRTFPPEGSPRERSLPKVPLAKVPLASREHSLTKVRMFPLANGIT